MNYYGYFKENSKIDFIMDNLKAQTLYYYIWKQRPFTEKRALFYTAELVLAMEEFYRNGLNSIILRRECILLDNEGHVRYAFYDFKYIFP